MGRSSERQEEKEKRIVKRLPYYGRFDYARLGYFSLTTKDTKFIAEDDSLTIDKETETPGYFFGKFMKGLWSAKRSIPNSKISYPYKAIPGLYTQCVYIDIRHAFQQIASAFGMEVFVQEGKFTAYGETLPVTPCFENKICRGLLVTGVSSKGSYQEWKNNDLRTITFSNPNYSPHVIYSIWSTLHAIQAILNPYTIYAHTDGFIIPRRHVNSVSRILDRYGFKYSTKASGYTQIYGIGSYCVGETETAITRKYQRYNSNIKMDNASWWCEAFSKGISLRNNIHVSDLFEQQSETTDYH